MTAAAEGRRGHGTFFVLAILMAVVLKAHYSVAGPEGLRWILAPTATLVGAATGASFTFEPLNGYLSADLNLLIAPVCAGVNFLVVVVLSATFGLLPLVRGGGRRRVFFGGVLALGYALTVVVNAARIVLGLRLQEMTPLPSWMTPADLHRAVGVVVYLSALFGAFLLARGMTLRGEAEGGGCVQG